MVDLRIYLDEVPYQQVKIGSDNVLTGRTSSSSLGVRPHVDPVFHHTVNAECLSDCAVVFLVITKSVLKESVMLLM